MDYYVKFGSTVNLCALDISKAFDKMNHYGLFIKLMNKFVPINLLRVLEVWFAIGSTCIKWCRLISFLDLLFLAVVYVKTVTYPLICLLLYR